MIQGALRTMVVVGGHVLVERVHTIARMADRATLRNRSQHIANGLLQAWRLKVKNSAAG